MRPFILFLVLLCSLTAGSGMATATIDQDVWAPLQFLFGEWEGADNSGAGSGHFSFTVDLQRKVVVRHNHAQYPPANGRPAYVHDDLMIVYVEGEPTSLKAIYFDTEGHVIRYVGQITASAQVTFVSE